MLSDHELDALRDIERRLRWDSPELARLFSTVEPPPPRSRRKRARAKLLVAAAVFTGMALRGPRMLNEAEVKTQKSPPLPRTSPPVTTVARRKGALRAPRSHPGLPSICSLVPPTTVATSPSQGRPEGHVDSRLLIKVTRTSTQ
jgi:hypothetical protein